MIRLLLAIALLLGCASLPHRTHNTTNSSLGAGKCPERHYHNGVRCVYRPPGESPYRAK